MHKLIKVPGWLGEPDRSGIDEGPGVLAPLFTRYPGVGKKPSEIEIPFPRRAHQTGGYAKAKNLPEVREVCSRLMASVASIAGSGDVPVVLMGDDSSAIGLAHGIFSAMKKDFGVVWFDAHGDLNTPETSPSGCLYGMGLAHIIGRGHPQLLELNGGLPAVKQCNVVLIGQRSLDPGEAEFIEANGITVFSPSELRKGFKKNLCSMAEKFKSNGVDGLLLHLDLDVIDPGESPAVRVPVKNGISARELYTIVKYLKRRFAIIGIGIANYAPSKDEGRRTLKIVAGLAEIFTSSQSSTGA